MWRVADHSSWRHRPGGFGVRYNSAANVGAASSRVSTVRAHGFSIDRKNKGRIYASHSIAEIPADARCWTHVAIPTVEAKYFWMAAPARGPLCRVEPPPASMKPSNCGRGQNGVPRQGVLQAVGNVNARLRNRSRMRRGRSAHARCPLIELDGTPNKGRLGANAILAVSMAAARASARACELPLYRYLAERRRTCCRCDDEHPERRRSRDNNVDFQEFMVMPVERHRFPRRCAGVWKFFIRSGRAEKARI